MSYQILASRRLLLLFWHIQMLLASVRRVHFKASHQKLVTKTQISSEHPLRLANLYTLDRKSTRLNSSHVAISYAVFCLKKKKYRNTRILIIDTKNVWRSI